MSLVLLQRRLCNLLKGNVAAPKELREVLDDCTIALTGAFGHDAFLARRTAFLVVNLPLHLNFINITEVLQRRFSSRLALADIADPAGKDFERRGGQRFFRLRS